MEILRKHAVIAPCLHDSVVVARHGSASPTATTAVSGISCRSRQCRPPPKIALLPQCHALGYALEGKQTLCTCSSSSAGGGSPRVYYDAQQFGSCRGGRELSRAESSGNFSCIRHVPISFNVGDFKERFELVCRVIHFMKCSRRTRPMAKSSLNSGFSNGEGNVDLELELFRLMQQSSKPDAFPTRQDLISAGRSDLALAIDQEGGWLAAGWDEAETSSTDLSGENLGIDGKDGGAARREKGTSRKRSTRKIKSRSVKRYSTARKSSRVATIAIDETERRLNGTNVVREVDNATDHKDGRKKDNDRAVVDTDGASFEDFSIIERTDQSFEGNSAVHERKPSSRLANDDLQVLERLESMLNFTDELKAKRPLKGCTRGQDSVKNDSVNGTMEATIPSSFFEESFQTETKGEQQIQNSLRDATDAMVIVGAPPERKRSPRKKGRAKVVNSESVDELIGTSDLIHQIFDGREKWMLETRSKSGENSFLASLVDDSKSTRNRSDTLAAKVVDTRAALQSVSDELRKTGVADDKESHGALSEFIDAEDTLEFRENAIMHARNELNTTRAQVAALEGNLKVEIMEARKILEERNRELERAKSISQHLRTARIVWPNHAKEVYLTGSFNGWSSQVKMEKSSAGVFTCSLPLYPGKYEIKFVVDGSWMVDTRRPIVYVGGFENNVLTVS